MDDTDSSLSESDLSPSKPSGIRSSLRQLPVNIDVVKTSSESCVGPGSQLSSAQPNVRRRIGFEQVDLSVNSEGSNDEDNSSLSESDLSPSKPSGTQSSLRQLPINIDVLETSSKSSVGPGSELSSAQPNVRRRIGFEWVDLSVNSEGSNDEDYSLSGSEPSVDGENGSMDTTVIEEDLNYSINRYCNDMQEPSTSYHDHTWDMHEDHSRRMQGRHFTLSYLCYGKHNVRCEVGVS